MDELWCNDQNTFKRKKVAEENYEIVKEYPYLIQKTCLLQTKHINGKLKNKNVIEFLPASTNQAIQHYLKENANYKIAVLNFANSHHPGGGYLQGACAQEEELCRTSPFLFATLNSVYRMGFYKNWNDNWSAQVLYTPNVLFVRDDGFSSKNNYDFLPESKQYCASVITAAAPNLRNARDFRDIPKASEYQNIIKQIYYTPIVVKNNPELAYFGKLNTFINNTYNLLLIDVLVVGAWGCGAFAPSFYPEYIYNKFVAEQFVATLSKIGGHYKKICFAIPKDKTNNYNTFLETFIRNIHNFKSITQVVPN